MSNGTRGIPIIDANTEYKDFLDRYLRPLKPCIVSGLTGRWSAAKEWTKLDSDTGTLVPNFSALKETFGEHRGCVTFCEETDSNGDAIQREMSVSQFLDNFAKNYEDSGASRKTYLKDFHFMRVNRSLISPYSVPKFFQGHLSET